MNDKPTRNDGVIISGPVTGSNVMGKVNGGQVTNNFSQPQTVSSPAAEETSKTQHFDICIVCALGEEAKAVVDEFTERCDGIEFKSAFANLTNYRYKHTIITNAYDEQLTVLVICMPFTGPTSTVNSVRSLIEEFHPRFIAMTGICAGNEKKIALGDLVAAAYAFSYEEGKVVGDENGQNKLKTEWRTHSATSNIVQYLNEFTEWLAPLSKMKQEKLGRELLPGDRPKCLIAPVASSMAVQANDPFPHLLEHNRKAVFLDQEVAAFYQTLNDFPDIYFLAVKSVCDFGNEHKDDDYHEYASRASAVYLLYFIRDYVTSKTMPRKKE